MIIFLINIKDNWVLCVLKMILINSLTEYLNNVVIGVTEVYSEIMSQNIITFEEFSRNASPESFKSYTGTINLIAMH